MVDQDDWIARLQPDSPEREQAIEQLRGIIVRGLSKSLAQRYGGTAFADDVAQDALLKILSSLDQFEGRSRFTTWAMAVATRVAISQARRRYFQDVSLERLQSSDGLRVDIAIDNSPAAPDTMDRKRVVKLLQQLIDTKLSERQKLAMRGLLEGLPVEEIAQRMDSNRNATYKLVHDARAKLRTAFEESGMTADDVRAIMA